MFSFPLPVIRTLIVVNGISDVSYRYRRCYRCRRRRYQLRNVVTSVEYRSSNEYKLLRKSNGLSRSGRVYHTLDRRRVITFKLGGVKLS